MSPMKITVVSRVPTIFTIMVDCAPYVFVSLGAMSRNFDHGPASEVAVAFGQEDDITVLTVTRLATVVESTTLLLAPALVSATG